MASKRAIRRRACEGKHRYTTQTDALKALRHQPKGKGFGGMHTYHCKFCQGFHLGHPPQPPKTRRTIHAA